MAPIGLLTLLGLWLLRRSQHNATQTTVPMPVIPDPSERLKVLQKMLADGQISQAEFDAKRAEIIGSV